VLFSIFFKQLNWTAKINRLPYRMVAFQTSKLMLMTTDSTSVRHDRAAAVDKSCQLDRDDLGDCAVSVAWITSRGRHPVSSSQPRTVSLHAASESASLWTDASVRMTMRTD